MSSKITIGSKIKIKINDKLQNLQIVGSADVDPKIGRISFLSPIGEAILGKEENENFIILLPSGKTVEGQVMEIQ